MTALGHHCEYEVFIADSCAETVLARIPWVSISWGRVNKGVSSASVTMDGRADYFACCQVLDVVHAWDQLLVIERNGHRVWDGLITGWSTGATITLTAYDRSVMLSKRFITQDLSVAKMIATDGFTDVILPLITNAQMVADAGAVPPVPACGVNYMPCVFEMPTPRLALALMAGDWRIATLTSLSSLFEQWGSTGLNFTQAGEVFYVSNDYLNWFHDVGLGGNFGLALSLGDQTPFHLNTDTIISDHPFPTITVDATDLYTVGYSGTVGQGIAGFVNIGYAGGTYVNYSIQGTNTEAQNENGIFVSGMFDVPVPATSYFYTSPRVGIEQIQLAPTFGGSLLREDLSNLLPGVEFYIDFDESCAMNVPHETYFLVAGQLYIRDVVRFARLESLDCQVSVDGSGQQESFTASFTAMARPV